MTLLEVFIWEFVPIYRFATSTLYTNTRQQAIPRDSSAPGVGALLLREKGQQVLPLTLFRVKSPPCIMNPGIIR